MVSWRHASSSDRRLYSAVSAIFLKHPHLLRFLFDDHEPRLRMIPEEMLREIRGFSSGEQILVRVAMDIWSGSGNAKIWQIVETLDPDNFANVLEGLRILRGD